MRYFAVALVIITGLLSYHCDSPQVNTTNESLKLDKLFKEHNYKLAAIDFKLTDDQLVKLGLELLNKKNDYLSAEKLFRYLLQKNPDNPEYLYYVGQSTFFIGEYNYYPNTMVPYELAYSYFSTLVAKFPKNTDYLIMKSFAIAKIGLFIKTRDGAYADIAKALIESDNIVKEILQIDPKHAHALISKGLAYNVLPGILGGDKTKGFELYQKIEKLYPNNMRLHNVLGRFYRDKKQYDKAIQYFEAIQKIYEEKKELQTPEDFLVYSSAPEHLGGIYYRQKKYKKAFESTKVHLQRRPYSASGHKQIGDCYSQFDNKVKAIESYKASLKYNKWNKGAQERLKILQ